MEPLTKDFGKIERADICVNDRGYLVADFTFSSRGWSVSTYKSLAADDFCDWLKELFDKAKISSFDKLKGKPVEVTFERDKIRSWRILTEVL